MYTYDKELHERETKLIRELGHMKFSFKKVIKVMELDALINHAR